MTVVGARIDNRLLHGVVATSWAPQSGATRVMIIDNEVATNPALKNAMKLGRPAGMAVSVITEDVALQNFKNGKYDRQKVYILAKTPKIFLDLVKAGVLIKELVLGGTLTYEDSIQVTKRAYIKKEEINVYKELIKNNVQINSMYTTKDKPISVSTILNKKEREL
ncbi:PTS sugar transporter subunit IIB [Lactobacillus sp. ESL0791]|uniref:PTS system mannose/fructose/N-acetylgalactosamine-transporter subunit IIB n=1 Tax=Lactobacillus sp. ESL0791 TaxID=2983234 RepID=UPI0023F72310|nr:PTS sugar transporter subunit IIB [Lactobacillus sp. ESL0791]MDF7638037.1 PTS sugar transporter subunit IIB [Lactobacillus sp. ESL0791]